MAQALFKRIRERVPEAELDVLAPGWSLPLLARMPEVRSGIDLGLGHGELGLFRRRRLGRALRAREYEWAIVLPRSAKAALVPAFARIPRRTGFIGEYRYGLLNDIRPFDPQRLDQTVRRFLALGFADDSPDDILLPALRVESDRAQALCKNLGLDFAGTRCVLAPGAEYGPAKRWPIDRFAKLARSLADAGHDVLLLGSAKEASIGSEIEALARSERVVNLCGRTELADAVDLLGTAVAAVCNDSGLMHVAAASGVPVIAIYGSSSPKFTPPLTRRARIIYKGLACSPCFRRTCPLGHLDCLRTISANEVSSQLTALIDETGAT